MHENATTPPTSGCTPYTLSSIDLMEQLSYYLTTEVSIPNELIITVIETVTEEIARLSESLENAMRLLAKRTIEARHG
jgi:hypothetical protein